MSAIAPAAGLITPSSYYSQPLSGRLTVPVQASVSLYAQFEHVQGIPREEGGLSLDRLKVIDSLLAQINAHRQAGAEALSRQDVNLKQPDQAIAELAAQARDMQRAAGPFQAWGTTRGLVFDLSA